MTQPVNQKIKVTFFKESGKYYASGTATVNHFLFEDAFKQDIVNTQDCLHPNWMGGFQVLTEEVDNGDTTQDTPSFATHLFKASDFEGLTYEGNGQ